MRNRFVSLTPLALFVAVLATVSTAPLRADGPVVRDQSDLDASSGEGINDQVVANDFVLSSKTRLTNATVWLTDEAGNDNGLVDGFDGTLGWAIYTDSSGPDNIVRAGASFALVQQDTGVTASNNGDAVGLAFQLDPPVTLEPGTYWFAFRDGAWGTAAAGANVYALLATAQVGATGAVAGDEVNAGSWFATTVDYAFALYGNTPDWDQSNPAAEGAGANISAAVTAHDISFASRTSFSSLEAWFFDQEAHDTGQLQNFSGELSWALYEDAAGKPGTFVTSGSSTDVDEHDTGLQSGSESDIVRVRLPLGRTVTVDPGTYWLALHEGSWLSADDGSSIFWAQDSSPVGTDGWLDTMPAAPGSWSVPLGFDGSFVLEDALLFASGFESGKVCAWSGTSGGVC